MRVNNRLRTVTLSFTKRAHRLQTGKTYRQDKRVRPVMAMILKQKIATFYLLLVC